MENKSYNHVLQKTGILKTFTVAKLVKKEDIANLKLLIKTVASSEEEYDKLLAEELEKVANMHDNKNPVPGIIYQKDHVQVRKLVYAITTRFCKGVKTQNLTKKELAFLITAIINELGLTQKDFINLRKSLEEKGDLEDDGEDDDNDEYPKI